MELAEGRSTRARRANAGNHLQELLEQGLDESEEALLRAHSEDTSDTSFTCDSDEEAFDVIDSDFSDEEVEGTLEGTAVETEADVWREERAERRRARAQLIQRSERLSRALAKAVRSKRQRATAKQRQQKSAKNDKGSHSHTKIAKSSTSSNSDESDAGSHSEESNEAEVDLRSLVRHRPAPTILLQIRLQAALERARHQRQLEEEQQQREEGEEEAHSPVGNDDSNANTGPSKYAALESSVETATTRQSRLAARRRRQRQKAAMARDAQQAVVSSATSQSSGSGNSLPEYWRVRLYEGDVPQHVMYCSGRRSLAECGVATVVAFSHALPPVFGGT